MIFRKNGFTLIELLIVVAIIGIMAAITIAVTRVIVMRARFNKTAADLKSFNNALVNDYNDKFPATFPIPSKDAWNMPYAYSLSEDGSIFCICSAGSDKKFGKTCTGVLPDNPVRISKFGCDICLNSTTSLLYGECDSSTIAPAP